MERRLAAVLIADVVGYVRLSQADEEGTRARFQADLHEIFEPAIAVHHGRLVKTMGDALLVEFHSVVDAERCAVEVQRSKAESNAGVPEDKRLVYRIGINLGDVIVEGDDIHGDGVNIADRLQELADPGGITISGTAYDHVKTKVEVGYGYLGEQRVKHVAEPVRVYRVLLDPKESGKTIRAAERTRRHWRWPAAAAALVAAVAAGVAAWQRPWEPAPVPQPPPTIAEAPPLPDKPSVAVLPFANLSDDPQQTYFADGMAEDLMTDLSRVTGLFVIARHSAFAYKGQDVDLKKVGRDLGVRYIVEGSVQRTGERVRINIQLIEAATMGHLWAERYDGSMADIFALQDRVTKSVVDALALKLTPGEEHALGQNETAVPQAYDEFLRGWEHYQRTTPADFVKAIPHFEQAIAIDPAYARANAALAMVYFRAYDQGWSGSLGITSDAAFRKARDYLELTKAHPTSTSHQVVANISRSRGWYADAAKEFQAAIALDPNDSWSYAYLSYSLLYAAKPTEAETQIETALRLDPHFPALFVFYRGLAQFQQNRMEEAAVTLKEAVRLNPDDTWPFAYLAASYAYLGRDKEAADAIAAFNAARVRQGGAPFVMLELSDDTPRYKPPPESPLIRGLLRLGTPHNFDSPVFDSLRLSARDVEALFFGHRVQGRTPRDGQEWGVSVAVDGTAVRFGVWDTGAGVAKVEGDRLCFVLSTTSRCGGILRNPGGTKAKENEYLWFVGYVVPFSQIE
jgi:adenylate cyclase